MHHRAEDGDEITIGRFVGRRRFACQVAEDEQAQTAAATLVHNAQILLREVCAESGQGVLAGIVALQNEKTHADGRTMDNAEV